MVIVEYYSQNVEAMAKIHTYLRKRAICEVNGIMESNCGIIVSLMYFLEVILMGSRVLQLSKLWHHQYKTSLAGSLHPAVLVALCDD